MPPSLRDEHFDALEPLDIDIVTDLDEIPPDYRDDTWWRGRHKS